MIDRQPRRGGSRSRKVLAAAGFLAAIVKPAAALAISIVIVSVVLLALGASPAAVLVALLQGSFGNWLSVTETLVRATPLIYAGLAVAISFQGALWNIGADGQLVIGALAAGAIGPFLEGWPHPIAILAMLIAGAIGGAIWGGVCGWLRARRDVNEVISTIMMNFIALQLVSWAVHGPLMEPTRSYPASRLIAENAGLRNFIEPSRLNSGIPLALVLAIGCWLFLFRTRPGFELRALGHNRRAAAFNRIPIASITIWAMALAGALAGLGGSVQVCAISHRLYERFSPGWGFEAIAVALAARLDPLAIIVTALLFGALDQGSQAIQRSQGVSAVLVLVIQAIVILVLLAFDAPALWNWSSLASGVSPQPEKIAEGADG